MRDPLKPTFDADGYPTDETETAIKEWDVKDKTGWMEYIHAAWNHNYGRIWNVNDCIHMATGGWSGNESIICAMQQNFVLWFLMWESSHRGGLFAFRNPEVMR